jgi:copper chaperone NosL
MLPEEPKDVAVIYVTDMGKVRNWDRPEPGAWIEAKKAHVVIGSRRHGGMDEAEAVPFSDRVQANAFAARNNGRVVDYAGVPRDYIFRQGD